MCKRVIRDKNRPPREEAGNACGCGKRFIDDVFVHLYNILTEEGIFNGSEPLFKVGVPLIDPGFFIRSPPFLPPRSLLLISSFFDNSSAERAYREVPELEGILLDAKKHPGIGDYMPGDTVMKTELPLLCGCDVRADIFSSSSGQIVIYKKQGSTHIEFPRGLDPKIRSVEDHIHHCKPGTFVDTCCGAGTLGLIGTRLGVKNVVLNDAWYAAAQFAGYNLEVNKEILGFDSVQVHSSWNEMKKTPLRTDPFLVAHASGCGQDVVVWQGCMQDLPPFLNHSADLTVIDPFNKSLFLKDEAFISFWQSAMGGEVFIP